MGGPAVKNMFHDVLNNMPLQMFLWACMGSVAIEIQSAYRSLQTSGIPRYYRKPLFWIVRVLLAMIGGGLTVAYDIHQPLLAINIGAATPIILGTLTSLSKKRSIQALSPEEEVQ